MSRTSTTVPSANWWYRCPSPASSGPIPQPVPSVGLIATSTRPSGSVTASGGEPLGPRREHEDGSRWAERALRHYEILVVADRQALR